MFERIEPDGVRWADGTFEPVDVILWATGFRPDIEHLRPLRLRSPLGGIQLGDTRPTSFTIVTNAAARAASIALPPARTTCSAASAAAVFGAAIATLVTGSGYGRALTRARRRR